MKVLFCDEKEPEGKSIADIFPESFFHTNLWLTFHNMLAFKRYRSAIEAKRYFRIFTHFMPESDYLRSFMPRNISDGPKVVPEGCKNLAFIGQYVETPEDAVFTVETSCRTGMYAAYALSGVDKKTVGGRATFYDLRYIVEQLKKIQNIEGNITAKDLPEINLLKWKETDKQVLSLINGIEKFPTLYPGKNLPKYKT